MKLLTVAVPCYNSAEYMRHAIDSILVGGEDVEILVVDDGSSDETAQIADEYAFHHPFRFQPVVLYTFPLSRLKIKEYYHLLIFIYNAARKYPNFYTI